ncbi:hypothetical protein NC651_028662 [Populus alba x Populus x berolinensis]|nr:hypothetical protein NC651_028662 [Populus alba x Populus x berolinensis]
MCFRLQPLSFEKSVPTMAPALPHLSLSLIWSRSLARKLTFKLHQIILLPLFLSASLGGN